MDQKNPDRLILIIKDEPYEVILKEEEGLVNRTIDTDLEIRERWYTVNGKKIPEINILWHVKGITPETALRLDTREQILILKDYMRSRKIINSIKNHLDNSISKAKSDYDTAVSFIFSGEPDYESSCLTSLRFACKLLRAKLQTEDRLFEENESLMALAGKLDEADFKEVEEIIPWVQKISEEGDDYKATFDDAVNAVRGSLALFDKLFSDKDAEKKGRGYINISS
ncbi:MAG: HEPN domain-containing protein [Deltaproteobacteria bacterium]|nr:HEPN domain-containing protein [Deltaproteobacteria bacterium]